MTAAQNLTRLRELLARARSSEAVYDHANGDDARRIANIYRDDIEALIWAIGLGEREPELDITEQRRLRLKIAEVAILYIQSDATEAELEAAVRAYEALPC